MQSTRSSRLYYGRFERPRTFIGIVTRPRTNLGTDLWNPLVVFNDSDNSAIAPSMQQFLGPGSQLNSLFTASPPPPNTSLPRQLPAATNPGCKSLNGLGGSKTMLSSDFHESASSSSVFNFADALGI
ncbi:hypothetical protein FBUS_01684 [Fasciolopsis buskii]|uniref:Uncharacterized protein n=1 Tax=Fasciolopsis buskii TaxID=27845 RepID=A0A8E0VKK9_9TREM|nr:hypothetical protein FBUS_01684 [Fasciolopsis buski]